MDPWESGDAYERYVGRWSRKVAIEFVRWLAPPQGLAWADVGCGTGALASTFLVECEPKSVNGVDSSEAFVSLAQQGVRDRRARFEKGDAARLPWDSAQFDVTVAGLVLNFVGNPQAMLWEMSRVTRSGAGGNLRLGLRARDADDALLLGCGKGDQPARRRAGRR
jgi:ubiquinone/menaquinone biosynthesis C-methylase UbiE